jgi:hypothetical protein
LALKGNVKRRIQNGAVSTNMMVVFKVLYILASKERKHP